MVTSLISFRYLTLAVKAVMRQRASRCLLPALTNAEHAKHRGQQCQFLSDCLKANYRNQRYEEGEFWISHASVLTALDSLSALNAHPWFSEQYGRAQDGSGLVQLRPDVSTSSLLEAVPTDSWWNNALCVNTSLRLPSSHHR